MMPIATPPIRKVYLIRSRPESKVLHANTRDGRPYLIGFLSQHLANCICRHVSPVSDVRFLNYSPQSFSIVRVEKKININKLPCMTSAMDFHEFMSYPFKRRLSIMFAFEIIDEDKEAFFLETQTYDAVDNVDLFRGTLDVENRQ